MSLYQVINEMPNFVFEIPLHQSALDKSWKSESITNCAASDALSAT